MTDAPSSEVDLSNVPDDQLIQMMQAHLAAPEPIDASPDITSGPEMFMRGATGDAIDYPMAGAAWLVDKSLGKSKSYEDELRQVRNQAASYTAQNPISGYGMSALGAVSSPLWNKGASVLGDALGGLPRILRYPLTGSILGGTAGLTGAQNPQGGVPGASDIAQSMETGGIGGAAFGTLIPAAMEGGGRLLKAVLPDIFSSKFGTPEDVALSKIRRALKSDNITPQDLPGQVSQLSPAAMPLDVSPNLSLLAEKTANAPGAGMTSITQALEDRQADQGSRLMGLVKGNVADSGFYDALDGLNKQRMVSAQPLYEKAFGDNTPIMNEQVDRLVKNPDVQKGINLGLKIIRNTNDAAPPAQQIPLEAHGITFNEAGEPIYQSQPTLRLMDAGVRGLDAQIETYRDPVTGKLNLDPYGRTLVGLRSSLSQKLVDLTGGPEGTYAQAKAAWSGPSSMMDAINKGRQIITSKDSELSAKILDGMSPEQLEYARIGAAKQLSDTINNSPDTANAARTLANSKNRRDILQKLLPPDQYQSFVQGALGENKMYGTAAQILRNSRTAARQAPEENSLELGPAAISAAQGHFGDSALQLVRSLYMKAMAPSAGVAPSLGKMLTTQGPEELMNLIKMLSRDPNKAAQIQDLIARSGRWSGPVAPVIPALSNIGGSNQNP